MSLGFYFNAAACNGCRACQAACKDRNDLAVGELFRKVKTYTTGKYPDAKVYHFAETCRHCDNAECVNNCPTGATQRAEDGTVFVDQNVCIGCGTCVSICPYGHPILLEEGVAGRCDSCKPFRDAGGNPVCVDACPMRALKFGDMDELRAEYGDAVLEVPCVPAAEDHGPNMLIGTKEAILAPDFREILW